MIGFGVFSGRERVAEDIARQIVEMKGEKTAAPPPAEAKTSEE